MLCMESHFAGLGSWDPNFLKSICALKNTIFGVGCVYTEESVSFGMVL